MYHVIVNPASKSGKGKLIWAELEQVLVDRGIDYKVVFSKKPGHVIKLVRDLSGYVLASSPDAVLKLIVLGGDGTLNEALQGISDFSRVEIGYIPTGSSNDLARDLCLPKDPVKCLNNILDCKKPTLMDIGLLQYDNTSDELSRLHDENVLSRRYFDVSAGIGYDAAICEEALATPLKNVLNKIGLGKLIYLIVALKQLIQTKRCECTMTLDDEKVIKMPQFLFIAAMIHQYEGGGFMFGPGASAFDGKFDICAVTDIRKYMVLLALPTALKGKHFRFKGIERYEASKIHIETRKPCWVHTDGEVSMKSDAITLECLKETLQLLK